MKKYSRLSFSAVVIGPLRVNYFPDLFFTPQTYGLFVKLSVLELEHSSTKSADRPNEFVNVYLCSIARVFILHTVDTYISLGP